MSIIAILFFMFLKLGFFSFGGGYSMIPLIEQALSDNAIDIAPDVVANITAIAGMSPGPVGVNLAIGFGYELAGIPGVISAALGVSLPSLITVVIIASIFEAVYKSNLFGWALDGLKPIIVGIILYAGVSLAMKNGIAFASSAIENSANIELMGGYFNIASVIMFIGGLIALIKYKMHPIILVCSGAIAGIMIF